MADAQTSPAGPDLAQGVTSSDLPARPLLGHVGDRDVLLVGSGAETSGASTSEAHASPPASISPVWPIVTVEG